MPIYTKKGDKGTTATINSQGRINKDSQIVQTLGVIDELNSFLGVAKSFSVNKTLVKTIAEIQKNLLTIGSITAGSDLSFSISETKKLEKTIDRIEAKLPPLKNFLFPGGGWVGSLLHYCRSLARKAERNMVSLSKFQKVSPSISKYLNRLSDCLFMLSREANFDQGIADEPWFGKKK